MQLCTTNWTTVTVRFLYPGYAVTSIISDYEYEFLSLIIFHLVELIRHLYAEWQFYYSITAVL
jgi:hypothetical protein